MAEAPAANGASRTPADFLKAIRGQKVVVKLNSGVDYKGAFPVSWMSCLQIGGDLSNERHAKPYNVAFRRDAGVPGWLHEHRHGANRGTGLNKLTRMNTVCCVLWSLTMGAKSLLAGVREWAA